MDPRRAHTERNMLPSVGPRFYRSGEEVMFEFVIDTANVIGPRPATRADQAKHAGAWEAFSAAEGVSALDRDASGSVGGSLPVESQSVPVQASPYWDDRRSTLVAGEGEAFVTEDGESFPTLRAAADHVTDQRQKRRGRPPKVAQ